MKFSNVIKMCLNWKVLLGIAIVIVLAYIFAPHFAQYSWVLVALVCPLSMVFMMSAMQHTDKQEDKKENKV